MPCLACIRPVAAATLTAKLLCSQCLSCLPPQVKQRYLGRHGFPTVHRYICCVSVARLSLSKIGMFIAGMCSRQCYAFSIPWRGQVAECIWIWVWMKSVTVPSHLRSCWHGSEHATTSQECSAGTVQCYNWNVLLFKCTVIALLYDAFRFVDSLPTPHFWSSSVFLLPLGLVYAL